MRRAGLGLLWWAVSASLAAGLLAAAFGAAGLAVSAGVLELGEVQREVWLGLAKAIGLQLALPLSGLTVAAFVLAARLRPGLDASLPRIALGLAAIAALAFPPVGALAFTSWEPGSAGNYLGTLAWAVAGTLAALLPPRRWISPLHPGTFGQGA